MIEFSTNMPETPSTFPFEILKGLNPHNTEIQCHQEQWLDILHHHQRTLYTLNTLINHSYRENVFFLIPNKNDLEELKLAISLHDIGKTLIPNNIHNSSKNDALNQSQYNDHYKNHPAQGLNFLGQDFIQAHPFAAALILNHHPNGEQDFDTKLIPDYHNIVQSESFRTALAILITVDGLTAGHEIRYKRSEPEKPKTTIALLEKKLQDNNLDNIINVQSSVVIGYQALSQLDF